MSDTYFTPPSEIQYPGFFLRLGAVCVDGLISGLIIITIIILSTLISRDLDFLDFVSNFSKAVIPFLYVTILESSSKQATIGKMCAGITVVHQDHKLQISFLRATARYLISFLSTIFFCAGYFMMFFTERKQTLHDKWSKVLLIQTKEPISFPKALGIFLPLVILLFVLIFFLGYIIDQDKGSFSSPTSKNKTEQYSKKNNPYFKKHTQKYHSSAPIELAPLPETTPSDTP